MRRTLFFAGATSIILVAAPANAAIVINITQSGANVATSLSGSFNLNGLTRSSNSNSITVGIKGNMEFFGSGVSGPVMSYTGLSGPSAIGTSNIVYTSTSRSGAPFVLSYFNNAPVISFATGYTSGATITSTTAYANSTLAALGLTQGQYVYRSTNDTVTINIGNVAAPVPEPATWSLMLLGLGAIGWGLRRNIAAIA